MRKDLPSFINLIINLGLACLENPVLRLRSLLRLVTAVCLTTCLVAILVGRWAPRTSPLRYAPIDHLSIVNGIFLNAESRKSFVVDARTGSLSDLPVPARQSHQWGSFSPWVDGSGEREVAGRWIGWSRGRPGTAVQTGSGLALLSFPSGRVLEIVTDAPIPNGRPCWYPGAVRRILYPATDGQLYECEFGQAETRAGTSPAVRAMKWTHLPPGIRGTFVESVTWPAEEVFGGRLLADVRFQEASYEYGPSRLCWLELGPDGTEIVGVSPITFSDVEADHRLGETCPSLRLLRGGRLLLTFQRFRRGKSLCYSLYLADVNVRQVLLDKALPALAVRRLADDVAHVPAALSPDGRSVFALVGLSMHVAVARQFSIDAKGTPQQEVAPNGPRGSQNPGEEPEPRPLPAIPASCQPDRAHSTLPTNRGGFVGPKATLDSESRES